MRIGYIILGLGLLNWCLDEIVAFPDGWDWINFVVDYWFLL